MDTAYLTTLAAALLVVMAGLPRALTARRVRVGHGRDAWNRRQP
jgi:hypothetical protein